MLLGQDLEYSFNKLKMKILTKRYNKHWNSKLTRDQKLKVKIQIFMISHKAIRVYILYVYVSTKHISCQRKRLILEIFTHEIARNKKNRTYNSYKNLKHFAIKLVDYNHLKNSSCEQLISSKFRSYHQKYRPQLKPSQFKQMFQLNVYWR